MRRSTICIWNIFWRDEYLTKSKVILFLTHCNVVYIVGHISSITRHWYAWQMNSEAKEVCSISKKTPENKIHVLWGTPFHSCFLKHHQPIRFCIGDNVHFNIILNYYWYELLFRHHSRICLVEILKTEDSLPQGWEIDRLTVTFGYDSVYDFFFRSQVIASCSVPLHRQVQRLTPSYSKYMDQIKIVRWETLFPDTPMLWYVSGTLHHLTQYK